MSRSAAVAREYAPHVGRPRSAVRPARPSHSIEPGWAGTPRRTTRPRRSRSAMKKGSSGSVEAPPAVRTRSTADRLRGRTAGARARQPPGRLDVHDVDDRGAETLDLLPDAAFEAFARRAGDILLDQHADPFAGEGGDVDDRMVDRQAFATSDDRLGDDVRGDLDARDEIARADDLAVEHGEHFERIDPVQALQGGDPDADDAVGGGQQVDATLVRAAQGRARAGDRSGETAARFVLVQVAGFHDEDGDVNRLAGGHAAQPRPAVALMPGRRHDLEVCAGESPPLRPALAADREVARQHGADQNRIRPLAQGDTSRAHAQMLVAVRGVPGTSPVSHGVNR